MARPGVGNVTVLPSVIVTVHVLNGPNPCPTLSMVMRAKPWAAWMLTHSRKNDLLPPDPAAHRMTGQPPAGIGPDGSESEKCRVLMPCCAGIPVREATVGMYSPGCTM